MSVKSIATNDKGQGSSIEIKDLVETFSHYAADPEWRDIFSDLGNLSEGERTGMPQRLETVPPDLVPGVQLNTALAFLRLNLESPASPRMMVKMIDYVDHRRGQHERYRQ